MKYTLFGFSLLMISFIAPAQTWSDLTDSLADNFNKKEYNKAIVFGKKALAVAKSEFKKSPYRYIMSVNNLALLYLHTEESEKGNLLFRDAKETTSKWQGEKNIEYAVNMNNLALFYHDNRHYEKAEYFYIHAIEIFKTLPGQRDSDYFTVLNNLARLYSNMSQYEKAESAFIKKNETIKRMAGESTLHYFMALIKMGEFYRVWGKYERAESADNHAIGLLKKIPRKTETFYISSVNDLAILYRERHKYKVAESLYILLIDLVKEIAGESDPDYLTVHDNLANLYVETREYEKAELLYLQIKEARKERLGENNTEFIESLLRLAGFYLIWGRYEKAESLGIRASELAKQLSGELDHLYATSLNNLAVFYEDRGKYEKAESLLIQSKEIIMKISGETHPDYATTLNNLASLYHKMGLFEKAKPLKIQAKEIWKEQLGKSHPDYVLSLSALADLYISMGQYEKAEPLLVEANEIQRDSVGEFHYNYATSLHNLATLYKDMGQYEKAGDLFLQAKAIWKESLGELHPSYIGGLNGLALLYEAMGQNQKAEPLLVQAIETAKTVLGETDPVYAKILNNLAMVYHTMAQYEKAESLYLQASEISKKIDGITSQMYGTILNNLAALYSDMKQYDKAELLHLQAKEIWEKILEENNPDFAALLINLAGIYMKTDQYEKAVPLILRINHLSSKNILNHFSNLSEKEKGNYIANKFYLLEINNIFLFRYKKPPPVILRNSFNQQLIFKSLTLTDTRKVLLLSQQSKDTMLQQLLKDWQTNKSILAKQYSLTIAHRRADLKQVETQTENLEKELNRISVKFRDQQNTLSVSMKDVQMKLEPDEVAIEFVRFNTGINNYSSTDSILYAAFILNKNDSIPVFVPLFEESQLQRLFDSAGTTATSLVSSFYRGLEVKNKKAVTRGQELYKLIWGSLEPYLTGVKKISYSPAGKLYTIAFHALPVDSFTVLMDKYQLKQYTSTRQVALSSLESQTIKPVNIVLFGNASFTMDSFQLKKQRSIKPGDETISTSIYTPKKRSNNNGVWSGLDGTASEVGAIKQLFAQNKISTKVLLKNDASEENLKLLSGNSPQILHIATHGFFLPEPDKKKKDNNNEQGNTYTLANDPLLRSGLILAGANYAWSGKKPIDGVEDGIATAYEISQLDLSNTELVVLSACETALGDVKGSEGVFGLQRAFKMAGVKKMIVSLWQVPDKETAELMTLFYANWMNGATINAAFSQAQAEMRKKYSPFYWAAFVLVE